MRCFTLCQGTHHNIVDLLYLIRANLVFLARFTDMTTTACSANKPIVWNGRTGFILNSLLLCYKKPPIIRGN